MPECRDIADSHDKVIPPWNAPSTLPLTHSGLRAKTFFLELYTTRGWWSNEWGGNGMGSVWVFVAMILSFESSPLWQNPTASGWGTGEGIIDSECMYWEDPKPLFSRAASQWFWNWGGDDPSDAAQTAYLKHLLDNPSDGTLSNAAFNWIGTMGSFKMMDNAVHNPASSGYVGQPLSVRLNLAMRESKWNAVDMLQVVDVIKHPDPAWLTGGLATWGNNALNSPNIVYRFGNFGIYIPWRNR